MSNYKAGSIETRMEAIGHQWLRDHYYSKRYWKFEKCDDKERQVRGCDLIRLLNGKRLVYDEKFHSSAIGKYYKDECLEISTLELTPNGTPMMRRRGWCVSEYGDTDRWILMSVIATKDGEKHPFSTPEIWSTVEVFEVDKKAFWTYLRNRKHTPDSIYEKAMQLINDYNSGVNKTGKMWIGEGLTLCYSFYYPEKPVNLLIDRTLLASISEDHCIINA